MKRFLNLALTAIMILNMLCTLGFSMSAAPAGVTESYIPTADGGYDIYPTWKGSGELPYTRKNIYTSAYTRCSFLKFDLTPIRQKLNDDYIVSSAEIKLTVYKSDDIDGLRSALYEYNSDGWSDDIPAVPLSGTNLADVNTHIISKNPADSTKNYVDVPANITTNGEHPTLVYDITDHFKKELLKPDDNALSLEVNYRTSGTSKTYRFYSKDFYNNNDSYKPALVVTYKPKEYKSAVTNVLVNGGTSGIAAGTANIGVDMKSWDDDTHSACLFGALYKKDALGNEIMTDIKAVDSLSLSKDSTVNKSLSFTVPSDADYFARVWVTDGLSSTKVYSNEFEITSSGISSDGSEGAINKFTLANASVNVNRANGTISVSADATGANKPFGMLVLKDGVSPSDITSSNIADVVYYASAVAGEPEADFKFADTILYEDFKAYIGNMGMTSQKELSFTYYLDSLPDQVFELMKYASSDGELAGILETYSSLIGITKYSELTMAAMAKALFPVNDADITEFSERYTLTAAVEILNLASDSAAAASTLERFKSIYNIDPSLQSAIDNPNLPAFASDGFASLVANDSFNASNVKSKLEALFIKAAVTNAPRYGDLQNVFENTNLLGGYFSAAFSQSNYSLLSDKASFYKKLIYLPLDTTDNIKSSIISAAASAYAEQTSVVTPSPTTPSTPSRPVGSISSPSVSAPSVVTPPVQTQPEAKSFTDVSSDMWMYEYVTELSTKGIVSGYGDGSFLPGKTITREEYVKLICEAAGIKDENAQSAFADVEASRWSYKYIAAAVNAGVINGINENSFAPSQNITRQDAAVIISRVLGDKKAENTKEFSDSQSISDYAKEAVDLLSSLGILTGDSSGSFRPHDSLTRAETCALVSRLIKLL